MEPKLSGDAVTTTGEAHSLWGLYTFVCDMEMGDVTIIPLRDAELHLNALKFLEPPPNLHLRIEHPIQITGNILDFNLSIIHPFLGLHQYTGFDVSGIIFTQGTRTGFNDPDIVMPGPGDTRLLNPDGYSRWWNPSEFPHGSTIFTYIDGLLGTPDDIANFNCTLNGYKYFADGLEANTPLTELNPEQRGMFSAGLKRVRHYTIEMSGGLIFNYAVDACWKKPDGQVPYFPPDCFPPDANRPEAYNVSISEVYNSLYFDDSTQIAGGNMKLRIDVWDHFNGSLNQAWGESWDGLEYVGMSAPIGGNEVYSTYELDFYGGELTHNGVGEALITVESEVMGYGNIMPDEPVCAYFTYSYQIADEPPINADGWARTWGGTGNDRAYGAECDSEGNIYITGYFFGQVDFDTGDGELILNSNGSRDAFLLKLNPLGDFMWAFSWGANDHDFGYAVDIDSYDDIYVTGYFANTVDFDPGPSVVEHTANGGRDVFLVKYDSDGNLVWVHTWGGGDEDVGQNMWIDGNDNVYVGGHFDGTVDFDPGPGVVEYTSNGAAEAYISKFDIDGNLQWARAWGGTGNDKVYSVTTDSIGNVLITGYFRYTVDFDFGDGEDLHTSLGSREGYLLKLDSNGDYIWARSWGGTGEDLGEGVSVGPGDNIYIAGDFSNVVDFDPGPGEDIHISNGAWDISLSKFNPDGDFEWARTWGSSKTDDVHRISIRGGNVFITGHYNDTTDFDPSDEGVDNHTSNGLTDFFLSKYDCFGNYNWTRSWGGTNSDYSRCVTSDYLGNLFIVGGFGASADMDPGPGEEIHYCNGNRDCFVIKMLPNGYW